ncbi:MAG: hypothetical protein HY868_08960 [Chloroflexi bacterium]|nr:hypothetical protein [Chloroflexota bacterium]
MSTVRQTILETLSTRGPLPLEELARDAAHTPMALRYHLARLMNDGQVVLQDAAHRGVVGRPQLLYALADEGHEELPKQYHQLAEQLIAEIIETQGPKQARVMLRRAGRRAAEAATPLRQGAGIQARVNRAAAFLSARGYLARVEKSNGDLLLRVCNCPYRRVAREHREVCELDIALVDALVDAPMKMTQCLANCDCACSFVIRKPK